MYEHFSAPIIKGTQHSSALWFPTINLDFSEIECSLEAWTYRVNVIIDNKQYRWLGPWFPEKWIFEVHILGLKEDLYGKQVSIIPLFNIRDNHHFPSLEHLKQQIKDDIDHVKHRPWRVMTFGTFDYFHPGHEAYLKQARLYGDTLITIVARDETVLRLKWALPTHTEQQRLQHVTQSWLSDIAKLGDNHDPYLCLYTHRPQVICLGYDQDSFDRWLRYRCDTHHLPETTILRLKSFEPERWKSSIIKHHKAG